MSRPTVQDVSSDQLLRELRRIAARLDRPLEARDVPLATWRAVLRCFGSVANARDVAGLPGPPLNHRWTEDGVLDEIRALARAGVTITSHGLKEADRDDVNGAIVTYFRSIVRARRLAGVPHPPRQYGGWTQWDDERVVAEILARHHAGESLASSKVPGKLLAAGIRYFGRWLEAIEAAGFDYDAVRLHRVHYTDEELLDLLRDLASVRPEMRREDLAKLSYRPALLRHFGSVDRALRLAGLRGWPVRVREQMLSASAVINAVRGRRREGQSTRVGAVQKDWHLLWFSGTVHFGNWSRVLAAAKIKNESPRAWTRDEILEALRARVTRKQSIKTTVVLREEPALYAAAKKHFGGYVAAAREVDGAPWATVNWTPELLIKELRRLAHKQRRLTAKKVGSRIASAAERVFGTFTAARRAAGLT